MAAKGAGGLRPLPAQGAGKQVTPLPPPVWLAGRGALRPGPPGWRPRGGRAPPPRSDPPPCGRLKPTSCWNRKGAARPTELTTAPLCGRRRPPPGTARRPGHGQQGGQGRPGRPLSPSSSPVFTPLARTLASRSAKVSCRTRSRSHTRLEGASCLCLPLPAPKISVPQEGFPRRNRGFFFSFGWEQTVFSTSEKHKEQKTKTRGNMAGAGFRPAHPPTRLLVGVRYGPAPRRRCSGAGDRAVNGTGHPRPSRSLRSTQGIAG